MKYVIEDSKVIKTASFQNDILKYGSVTYYNGNSIKTFEIENNTNKKFNCISLKCKILFLTLFRF